MADHHNIDQENEALIVNQTPEREDKIQLDTARPWKPGVVTRFPKLGATATFLVSCSCIGILVMVAMSHGKDYDSWCRIQYSYSGLTHKETVLIKPRDIDYIIPINIWISIFSFICGKLLALAFVESVIIHWWLEVLDGKTVRRLNHDYESARSGFAVLKNIRLINWVCFCSIVYTMFGVMGPILQKSSALTIETGSIYMGDDSYSSPSFKGLNANMTTQFPINASAEIGPDGTVIDIHWLSVNTLQAFSWNHDVVVKVDSASKSILSHYFGMCRDLSNSWV